LSLLNEFKEARGLGIDNSVEALRVAASNSARLGMEERASFIQSDWLSAISTCKPEDKFQLVVSNPPYIAEGDDKVMPDVVKYEPHSALFAGGSCCCPYRDELYLYLYTQARMAWMSIEC